MWTLWIFGPALEDRLGAVRFSILYLLAGVAASVTHAIFNASSDMPVIGASGAIAGIIAAYAVRFPYAWVRVLVLIVFIRCTRLLRASMGTRWKKSPGSIVTRSPFALSKAGASTTTCGRSYKMPRGAA
jgi:membrane associated rhomboid family serine protease